VQVGGGLPPDWSPLPRSASSFDMLISSALPRSDGPLVPLPWEHAEATIANDSASTRTDLTRLPFRRDVVIWK
jgi:hypothetical protein